MSAREIAAPTGEVVRAAITVPIFEGKDIIPGSVEDGEKGEDAAKAGDLTGQTLVSEESSEEWTRVELPEVEDGSSDAGVESIGTVDQVGGVGESDKIDGLAKPDGTTDTDATAVAEEQVDADEAPTEYGPSVPGQTIDIPNPHTRVVVNNNVVMLIKPYQGQLRQWWFGLQHLQRLAKIQRRFLGVSPVNDLFTRLITACHPGGPIFVQYLIEKGGCSQCSVEKTVSRFCQAFEEVDDYKSAKAAKDEAGEKLTDDEIDQYSVSIFHQFYHVIDSMIESENDIVLLLNFTREKYIALRSYTTGPTTLQEAEMAFNTGVSLFMLYMVWVKHYYHHRDHPVGEYHSDATSLTWRQLAAAITRTRVAVSNAEAAALSLGPAKPHVEKSWNYLQDLLTFTAFLGTTEALLGFDTIPLWDLYRTSVNIPGATAVDVYLGVVKSLGFDYSLTEGVTVYSVPTGIQTSQGYLIERINDRLVPRGMLPVQAQPSGPAGPARQAAATPGAAPDAEAETRVNPTQAQAEANDDPVAPTQ